MSTIQERLLEHRRLSGRTQQSVANVLKISNASISGYEKGTRNIPPIMLSMLAAFYGVNEEWLRTGKGEAYRSRATAPFGSPSDNEAMLLNFEKSMHTALEGVSPSKLTVIFEIDGNCHIRKWRIQHIELLSKYNFIPRDYLEGKIADMSDMQKGDGVNEQQNDSI